MTPGEGRIFPIGPGCFPSPLKFQANEQHKTPFTLLFKKKFFFCILRNIDGSRLFPSFFPWYLKFGNLLADTKRETKFEE